MTLEQEVQQIQALKAALQPFAEQAKIIDSSGEEWFNFQWFKFDGSIAAITLGDCRNAAKVLEEIEKGQ